MSRLRAQHDLPVAARPPTHMSAASRALAAAWRRLPVDERTVYRERAEELLRLFYERRHEVFVTAPAAAAAPVVSCGRVSFLQAWLAHANCRGVCGSRPLLQPRAMMSSLTAVAQYQSDGCEAARNIVGWVYTQLA